MRLHAFIILAAAVMAFAGCGPSSSTSTSNDIVTGGDQSVVAAAPADSNTAVLHVNGMGCPLCANNVDQQLLAIKGVEQVKIDLGTGQVLARLSPDNQPTREQLAKAVADSGFTLVKIDMPR